MRRSLHVLLSGGIGSDETKRQGSRPIRNCHHGQAGIYIEKRIHGALVAEKPYNQFDNQWPKPFGHRCHYDQRRQRHLHNYDAASIISLNAGVTNLVSKSLNVQDTIAAA